MLRLKVQGAYLNLPDNIQVNLTIENPLLLTNRIPVPSTLSFELEPTDHNLARLGYPNRINSVNSFRTYTNSQLEFGPVVFLNGTFLVLGVDKTIKCQMIGIILSPLAKKPGTEVDIERYDFGAGNPSVVDFDNGSNYAFMYRFLFEQSIAGAGKFVAGPVRIKDAVYPNFAENEIPTSSGFYAASQMYFNFYNARDKNYLLNSGDNHTVCFPQPFVKDFLDKIFGSTLATNPFSSGDLAKLVLITSFHQQFHDALWLFQYGIVLEEYGDDGANYFKLSSFMPSTPVNDIVRDLLKIFCSTMYCINGKIHIINNSEVIDDPEVEDWTRYLIGKVSTVKNELQTYNSGYADYKEEPATVSPGNELATVADLVAEDVTSEDPVNYLITSINQVISKRLLKKADPEDPDRWAYNIVRPNFGGSSGGENAYDMVANVCPLQMNVENYWWLNIPGYQQWYVPVWAGDRSVRPDKAYIMFYNGLKETFVTGDEYPFLSSHNIDHFGDRMHDTSLHFEGADGLREKYHSSFQEWIEKEKVRGSGIFLLSALDLKNLRLTKKKSINGKSFLVEKVSVTLRKFSIDPAQVDIVEA